jgi:hypothetical protein
MGCLFVLLAAAFPRVAAILYWLVEPARWSRAFDGAWVWPLLGIIVLPITTIVWVIVSPNGVASWDFLWLGIAVFADLGSTSRAARR